MKLAPTLPGSHPTRNVLAGHFSVLGFFFWGGGWVETKNHVKWKNMDGLGKKMPGFYIIPAKLDAKWKQNLDVAFLK